MQRCRTPPTRHVYHFFRSDKTKLKQLLLEDGGNDMKTAAEDLLIRNKTDPNKTKFFYTSFLNLFDGLIFFNKNKFIHFDIKLINLVYNSKTGVSKYIDFGLMKTHKKVITDYTNNIADYAINHFNWPPENGIGLKEYFDNPTTYPDSDYNALRINENAEVYKKHFGDHSKFLKKLVNTFDSWSLCTALLDIFDYAQ